MKIGANYSEDSGEFVVWAPNQKKISLVLPGESQVLKMDSLENGYWRLKVKGIKPNSQYLFRLNDQLNRPDPASNFQPKGVFGPSELVDHSSFVWKDDGWRGLNLKDMIMYELHVGAFSPEGTFAGAKSRAQELAETGINAVELMPVSQFSGARNWGYDTVFPFAVQNSYGGPDGLKELVQEFHSKGIAVILDVIYNHIGPEGNFLKDFGPYFLSQKTPWGEAINFDGLQSLEVRNFFLENARYWFKNYHVDGLRLDAVFTIIDKSPKHILKELSETVKNFSKTIHRKLLLIAENDRVDPEMIRPMEAGGFGLDALWHDNLHHSLHAALTGERNWYYSSFGTLRNIIQALNANCIQSIKIQTEEPLRNNCTIVFDPSKLVVFSQNHDQVGNRPLGERLITIAGLEAAKLAAGFILLSPFTPLLFMGEEYGEKAPFLFFTDYTNKILGKKVTSGRKAEIKKNGWENQPPDPQNPETFLHSKIGWQQRHLEKGEKILAYYKKLISLRKDFVNGNFDKRLRTKFLVSENKSLLIIQKRASESFTVTIANFSSLKRSYKFPCAGGVFEKVLDSADSEWQGPGSALPSKIKLGDKLTISPFSMAVYLKLNGEDHD